MVKLTHVALGLLGSVVVWELAWGLRELHEVKSLYQNAKEAAAESGKPLLVVGRPDYGMTAIAGIPDACGAVCLDLNDGCPTCPTSVQGSVEDLSMFPDGSHVIFLSHVLEHVCKPERVMAELERVAGKSSHLFIAFPRAWSIAALAHPTHRSLMGQSVDGSWWFRQIPGRECNIPSSGV